MESSAYLSGENESTTSPSLGKEPATSYDDDDNSTDDTCVVGPPSSKKAKIENKNEDDIDETASSTCSVDSLSLRENETSTSNDDQNENNDELEEEEEEQQDSSDDDDDDEQQQEQQIVSLRNRLDCEGLNLDDEEANSDDEDLFQQILAAAAAGRIPLEYLAARGIHLQFDEEDDEPVEYPFDHPPTSIGDVVNFIQSEKCQRIMVLAG